MFTRDFFVHPGATPHADPDSDAVVYVYVDARGRPCAQAFAGRAARPKWHYAFSNENARTHAIDGFFGARRAGKAAETARRAARKQPHSLKLGRILVATWGWEQTNVDFYQVTRVVGPQTVEARRVAASRTENGYLQGTCVPIPESFTGTVHRYRASSDNRIRVSDHAHAHPWDGKPAHWTAYA